MHSQPTQPSTFAIRTCQHATKNCKRVCLANTQIDWYVENVLATTAGYSPCRKSRVYKNMNGKIKDVTLKKIYVGNCGTSHTRTRCAQG